MTFIGLAPGPVLTQRAAGSTVTGISRCIRCVSARASLCVRRSFGTGDGNFRRGLATCKLPRPAGANPPTICSASKWPNRSSKTVNAIPSQLQALLQRAVTFWQNLARKLQFGSVRSTIATILLLAGALTAAANIWGTGPINARMQAHVAPQVAHVLGREVSMGKVNWLVPTGVMGVHPIVSVGPVSLGPGEAEGSWAYLPEVRVSMDPVKSLLQHKLVLHLHAPAAEVDLVQASNLSWFGFPEDTVPSARSFLPGLNEVSPTDHIALEGLSEAGAEPQLQQQMQAQARQALRQQQRSNMVTPPDAAANFSPAVGKDIISEGYMRPRVRVKPTFPQAAPSVQQRASSHSLIAASTPISTQTASASAASTDAQDAERRASGQSASTSGPGQEQPSISGHAKGRSGRRNGGNAPFAAISLGHGHGRNVAQSDYTPMVHQAAVTAPHADASLPQLHKSPAVSAEHSQHTSPLIAAQLEAKTAQSMAPAVAQPEAVVAQPEAGQPAATLTRNADTSDGHGILMPEVYTSDKPQHHLTDGDSVTTDAKHTDRSSGVVHRQRRSGPSAFPPMPHEAHAYSSTTQPATSESARSAPTAFPQLPHEAHAYSLFAQRDESSFVYKPGPAAFPQPLHEVALQSAAAGQDQALAVSQNAVTGLQAESAQQQPAVELHAAADESEFATQQQTYQKSLLQFAKSHHGGYVQREGHERAPHRRTTRSMLRGADVKTGIPLDPGLASYHMPPLPSQTFDTAPETQQQELHSPDMVHQQPAVESMPLTEAAVEQEHRSVTGTVAEQAPVQKLQHALAKTQEVGKMAVDQIWSSATDIQAKGKAAVDHVNASAPDLAPVNKHLQDLSQVVLQQTQAAATQGQHIGQSSFRQVRSSASGVTKQIPWDRLQPPSWLPGLPQSSFDSMQQQNIPADAAPFVQQHYSNSYRPAHGVYASDTTVAPSSAGIEQVHVVNAASAQEPALPAYRWHSKNHTNHLAALSAAPSQHSASFSSPFSADAPIPNCTFVQSSIQLPGVPEYSNITSHLCAQTDAPLQMPQQLPTPGSVESVLLGDLSDSQPGGAEQETASLVQEPASLTTNGSARYSWDRTGRLVGDGTASPHYKPGAPHAPRGAWLQRWLGQCGRALLDKAGVAEVALDSVTVTDGQVNMWIAGESVPRQFEQADYTLSFGRDYQDLDLTLSAAAHERDPSQAKCTMLNRNGTRNLRGVTGASQASYGDQPVPVSDAEGLLSQQAMGPQQEQDGLQESGSTWQHHRPQRQRPTGGKFQLHVHSDGLIKNGDTFPDLSVTLTAQDLHAPLCERLMELPVDITAGRIDGDFRVHCHDAASWNFPSFAGQVACKGMDFHFWDAVDDLSRVDMTLVFEDQRMYMHNASGMFGSVPLTLSGDVGINPENGQYRLSGEVAGVEVNELRKTLAIRPTPYSVSGAVRGVLHVSGPLEQPIFSGTAVATEPTAAMLAAAEDCSAKTILHSTQGAVGAYDKLPLASASCLFTMDTSTDIFILHSFQAEPVGGGQLLGSGRMWLAPSALEDLRAVRMSLEAHSLPTEAIIKRYIPQGFSLPASLVLGPGDVKGSMEGSHVNPVIQAAWQVPAAQASGHIKLDKDTMQFSSTAPALDVSSTLHMRPVPVEIIKAAVTQAEVTAASAPTVEGAEVDANFKELDVTPLMSPGSRDNTPGQSQKLKLTGHTQLSGHLSSQQEVSLLAPTSSSFQGEVALKGLRVNQLELSRELAGTFQVSDKEVHIHAKGAGVDEALDIDLALPLFQPQPAPMPKQPGRFAKGFLGPHLGGVVDMLPMPNFAGMRKVVPVQTPTAPAALEGGTFDLRCGPLHVNAQVNGSSSVVNAAVGGLQLDELELASLRGEVKEVSLSVNFDTRMGRATVNVAGPRFSGLQGEALSGVVRWERDIIRLEKAVLQQTGSSYKVTGQYNLPPDTHIPDSAASMAQLPPTASPMDLIGLRPEAPPPVPRSSVEQALGRWELEVNVEQADMEEISPAAPLLNRAATLSPSEYQQAKDLFLTGLESAGIQAQGIVKQLEDAMQQGSAHLHNKLLESASDSYPAYSRGSFEVAPGQVDGSKATAPGWQDVKGIWKGTVGAYGGGGGVSNFKFDITGWDWQYPFEQRSYKLDKVKAVGSCHSLEGLKLDWFEVKANGATLWAQGDLLGAEQKASFQLSKFPVGELEPVFRNMPLLKDAPPAHHVQASMVQSADPKQQSQGLDRATEKGSKTPATVHSSTVRSNSPFQGLLDVYGTIGGSATMPEGNIKMELHQGQMGITYLSEAIAEATLDDQQRLAFKCHLVPSAGGRPSGHVFMSGSVPVVLDWMPAVQDLQDVPTAAVVKAAEIPQMLNSMSVAPDLSEDESLIQVLGANDVQIDLDVKDEGMMLINTVAPDFEWHSGTAEVSASVAGQYEQPAIKGNAQLRKAIITCSKFESPMTGVYADIDLANDQLQVNADAQVGKKGHIKVKGALPLAPPTNASTADGVVAAVEAPADGITVDIKALKLKMQQVYSGMLDADLRLQRSVYQPEVGGNIKLSRAEATIPIQGAPSPSSERPVATVADEVKQAFDALRAKQDAQTNTLVRHPSIHLEDPQQGSVILVQPAVAESVMLKDLTIELEEFKANILNAKVAQVELSGQVHVSGPANPHKMHIEGTIKLGRGEVNLLASVLKLDREHSNTLIFSGNALNPQIDVRFKAPGLSARIHSRAAVWHSNVTITSTADTRGGTGVSAAEGKEQMDQLDPHQAVKLFESSLASGLVAEDGQLDFWQLLRSNFDSTIPKLVPVPLSPQGQLGQIRWRAVSPLTLDGYRKAFDEARAGTDMAHIASALTNGAELEVNFGKSLQAIMARKLRSGDNNVGTEWALNYQLHPHLRMTFHTSSSMPYPRSVFFHWNSEGMPRLPVDA